jgi:hypothetical protein
MRFPGMAESTRPDWVFLVANPDQGAAFRSGPVQAIGMRRKERIRWFHPSVQMSSGRLFLDRVGRHQSPSPLHRHSQHNGIGKSAATIYHRTVGSVLTGCLTPGGKRKQVHSPFIELVSPEVGITSHVSYTGPELKIQWVRNENTLTGYFGIFGGQTQ